MLLKGVIKISEAITKQTSVEHKETPISMLNLLIFFLPLACKGFFMKITQILLNSVLARFPNPEIYLSAYAVSKSFMHLIASSETMIRQTVTALVNDRDSYYKVRKFTFILVGIIFCVYTVVSMTGLSRWIMGNIMGLEGKTLDASVTILRVMILFPFFASFRNFYQGFFIKFRMTPIVTITSIVRIILMILLIIFIDRFAWIPAAILAGLIILSEIIVEFLFTFLAAKVYLGDIPAELEIIKKNSVQSVETEEKALTGRFLFYFFVPLAVTAVIKSGLMPVINMGLARTDTPEIAISAFAVAWGLGHMFLSPLSMFHQIPMNFLNDNGSPNTQIVRKFAVFSSVFLSSVIAVISFTGAGYYILVNLIGVTHQIADKGLDVLKIMILMPPLEVAREYYWGLLMKRRMTKCVGKGKTINIVVLSLAVTVMMFFTPSNPAVIGAIGMVVCEISEFLYLFVASRKNGVVCES